MRFDDYDFPEPFVLDDLEPIQLREAGAFAITAGRSEVLDVGEADDIGRALAGDPRRRACWRHRSGARALYVHALVEADATRRQAVSDDLRGLYAPPCGPTEPGSPSD